MDGLIGRTAERRIDVGNHSWVVQVSDKKTGMLSAISRITLFFGAVASLMVMAIGRLITRRAAEDRLMLERLSREASIRNSLTRELNHRVKNTLANVLSIAALTRRGSRDIDDFTDRLTSRIRALSATHDLLSQTDWTNAALRDVVVSELAPYMEGHEEFVTIDGPEIKLAPNDAMSLGLALHEMATNAAKYGALSVEDGRVSVTWQRTGADLASIHWREIGRPDRDRAEQARVRPRPDREDRRARVARKGGASVPAGRGGVPAERAGARVARVRLAGWRAVGWAHG
ncbi:sensor histidine kinase [Novosphingobium colocasiae]